ncbi:MAG TPA: DUF3575 domain-containing protein [Bacteroidales bacterium]|nr:DUF3575 domain-containing protein [Bacteroidales bacterium]
MIKKGFILILITFFSQFLSGQIKTLTVAPLGLVNKVRVKYEQQLSFKEMSMGSYFNVYYAYFQGIRLDPFVRFYFFSDELKGLYLQLKVMGGIFQNDLEYKYYTTTDTLSVKQMTNYYTFGGGPALGYQWYINSKIPLDVFVGFNLNKWTAPNSVIKNNIRYELFDDALWYVTGPGSIFHMHVGIGVKF